MRAVDYASLWITGLTALWISQHLVLGRIYPRAGLAVDYDASHLWITGFALWITRAVLAVD